MKRLFPSMTAALVIGVTLAVVASCGIGGLVYSRHHFKTLLRAAESAALNQAELIRVALEYEMLRNERDLIERMIERFGREPGVQRVILVDRQGRVQSPMAEHGADLSLESETCQACHRFPPAERTSSRVIRAEGNAVLRTVVPFRNREECHSCHDPSHRINGVLIVDTETRSMRAAMDRDLRWMALGTGALMLVLVAAIGLVVRLAVLRRLRRFETTARRIAAGELSQRVPADGSDTVSWLGREFNTMADNMASLLGEVREQRERLETVLNSVEDGIVVLSKDRRVVAANEAFIRRTGQKRGDLLGTSCVHAKPGMCGVTDCPTLACLASGEGQVRICERRTDEGDPAWEEVYASPIFGPSGAVVQVVEVWRDISKRRAAEAELAESHRLASLGMLASGFSHEINTPLATALMCVEGILRAPEDSAETEEHARTAREQLLRCGGITQQFLHLASGKAGPPEHVDLNATLAVVARLLAPVAKRHGVSVEVEPAEDCARPLAVEAELQQVLLNLVLNAIQASPRGAAVRLGARGRDPLRIFVADQGCGIDPLEVKKIFEPFYGLRKGGTGLGLFLSLDFVRRWGGDIEVESRRGLGSTFEIVFPSAALAASPVAGLA